MGVLGVLLSVVWLVIASLALQAAESRGDVLLWGFVVIVAVAWFLVAVAGAETVAAGTSCGGWSVTAERTG